MISVAAGLSNQGLKPNVHTIAPFIVSRAYEQMKIDFGYNKLKEILCIGASYDYASLGCTHHCPEDINLMYNIPDMQIVVPGIVRNLIHYSDKAIKINIQHISFVRSENLNKFKVRFGKVTILIINQINILAIGPVLNFVYPLVQKYKVNLYIFNYYKAFIKKLNRF